MDGIVTQVGVGGIFALLVIKEVFQFIKNKNGNLPPPEKKLCIHSDSYKKHCDETHDMSEVIKRLDTNIGAIKDESTKQTLWLEMIAKNGGKK